MSRSTFIAAALTLAVTLPAMPAQAGAPRTFVSAAGTDNSTCSFAAPCRHFQAAVDATSAGGEVDALDPAGYGPIVISHAITIEGQGWSYIAPPANGNGITINAASTTDKIVIHGVLLNGAGIDPTTFGIQFNSGGSLTVRDSVIHNFTGDGIIFQPSVSSPNQLFLFVSNTLVSDNTSNAINIAPTGSGSVTAVLSEIEVANCFNGINTGLSATVMNIMVRNSTIVKNASAGLNVAGSGTTIRLTRSTLTGNFNGWSNGPGTISSYGGNNIDGNVNNNGTPPNPLTPK